ncbi:MAG: hypothetical protein R3E87_01605 [Burkholderiaceae bacterium]
MDWKRGFAYVAALIVITAIGMWSIVAIHARMPEMIDQEPPVETQAAVSPAASTANWMAMAAPIAAPPASVALMRDQGWVRPQSVEIYDAANKESWQPKDGIAAEIAIVPEVLSSVLPMAIAGGQTGAVRDPLATLTRNEDGAPGGPSDIPLPGMRPPPPLPDLPLPGWGPAAQRGPAPIERAEIATVEIGANGAAGAALPPGQPDAAAGTQPMPPATDLAGLRPDPAPSGAGTTGGPAVGNTPSGQSSTLSLAELTEQRCAQAGFFGRSNCEQRVKEEYCDGRWGNTAECRRKSVVINF